MNKSEPRVESRPKAGPRIYNLFPSLAGSTAEWKKHLPRIAGMAFDWIFLNPFHYPGFSGSLYAVKDYYALNPLFSGRSRKSADAMLTDFIEAAEQHGLAVMMDLVINHTARDSVLAEEHPEWFSRDADGQVQSPFAIDPVDPDQVTVWGDLAEVDYSPRPERDAVIAYWQDLVRHYIRLGFRGFRCDAAYKVPPEVWRSIIGAAREDRPNIVFAAETLGCRPDEVTRLANCGFDYLFNSVKWWDFRSDWLFEQYDLYRRVAPTIGFPESHDTERLATELAAQGLDGAEIESRYRQRYLLAAAFSAGLLMPMGYEFGFRRKLDVVKTRPGDWEEKQFDLSDFIADANRMKASMPSLNTEAAQRRVTPANAQVVALLREPQSANSEKALTLINTDAAAPGQFAPEQLGPALDSAELKEETPGRRCATVKDRNGPLLLEPLEVRVFRIARNRPELRRPRDTMPPAAVPAAGGAILIEKVYPELDCGRYPVKREVGDDFEVWATIFKEGHDKIAAVLKYRRSDEPEWQEASMLLENPGLDRWRGNFRPQENARYRYTIEAWVDAFESWRQEVEKKRGAGQDVSLELIEGRNHLGQTVERAVSADKAHLTRAIHDFDTAQNVDERAAILLAEPIRQVMARWPDRRNAVRYDRELELVVDRTAARFAAWYEMFPRSQGTVPGRSATFAECAQRLPEIRAMGFDVVYLVPIHPIGRTHRKGPNNTLDAGPDDPGSPYAIGAAEGGHTAVHPELGSLEDFRRFVAATHEHGMEVALDFAIQCSPDHPWIQEHPEWFQFRPDGSIKYAENPPKKYQDIVNVNFYGPHREALWQELLNVVLFWVEQGVKIFRVDNPHTKPVPFWEWLIRAVQDRHPEVIFLSEAFTRPPMLQMLAKVGFSQSYTYFTWRNFKHELTEYLTELTQTEVKEYLRPNFFTNTPDILPGYLQTGGRPAFQVRLVLAATLSSVYGIYNGFELCENAAVPNSEEYLHSEKYEYKVWDWDRPGNIKDYIARVNAIRRDNPALHELDNLRFYPAHDDNVLFYGKLTADGGNMIFVAVNLDPFEVHEAEIEFPLHAMSIPEDETFEVEELLDGAKHLWRGSRQHVRLDPHVNPAAIFRVNPWAHVDYRSPCF